jgi:hypothetical protein
MGLKIQIEEADTHPFMKAVGQYDQADLSRLLDQAKEEAQRRGFRRVLLDLSQVAGTVPVFDMFVLAEHFVRIWSRATKIAIVSREGAIDKFFENVACNRGYPAMVVSNQEAGLERLKT